MKESTKTKWYKDQEKGIIVIISSTFHIKEPLRQSLDKEIRKREDTDASQDSGDSYNTSNLGKYPDK